MIYSLDDEILIEIFKRFVKYNAHVQRYVTDLTSVASLSLICKRFNKIVTESLYLWKHYFTFEYPEIININKLPWDTIFKIYYKYNKHKFILDSTHEICCNSPNSSLLRCERIVSKEKKANNSLAWVQPLLDNRENIDETYCFALRIISSTKDIELINCDVILGFGLTIYDQASSYFTEIDEKNKIEINNI